MSVTDGSRSRLVTATALRTAQILEALKGLDEEALLAPSELPEWSRLTIACHLRYGAEALCRMTEAALSGDPAAYYPEERDRQRPRTLVPRPGESNLAVVASLAHRSEELTRLWSSDEVLWDLAVVEPPDKPDLGTVDLGRLLMLRLTEVGPRVGSRTGLARLERPVCPRSTANAPGLAQYPANEPSCL